ncbi:MAG: acyl CoA:acetate/3-ketoacid CoA transferase [Paracoccaceae bacterium]
MRNKVVTADEAARLISDGDVLTTSGFVGIGVPDALLAAIARRFEAEGHPRGLGLVFAGGQGDGGERGLNRLGAEGLLARVVGGHWGLIPTVGKLCLDGKIEGWNLPQGCISQLYRDIAAGKPGMLSKIGLETFVDPRQGSGAINERSTEKQVELMEIGGEEVLFYRRQPITVALLRGTTADEAGNVTMEDEALILDNLAQAQAARNNGGIVIVQVARLAAARTLDPRGVIVPGALVDAVVVAEPEMHLQTYATAYDHAFTGRYRAPASAASPPALDKRKAICRRAAFELPVGGVVNLGIGMPEGVAAVADEEGLLDHVTLTAEPGVVGGRPASGLDFGAAVNTDAIITQNAQFDFYDGGGLDMACLGMAEADEAGHVNVSRFGPKLAGAGGFINISQTAKSLVFAGTFTAGGLEAVPEDGRLRIETEGRHAKFKEAVEQITFSGNRAARLGQPVLYVTERAVFELTPDGLALIEIAPGIDLEQDVLARMAFRPLVGEVAEMDARIFRDEPMGLKRDLLHLDLADRIQLDEARGRIFVNFEKMRIRSRADVDRVAEALEGKLKGLDAKIDAVVNYDGTRISEEVADDWAAMVEDIAGRYYARTSRYAGSAFLRMKLGHALSKRRMSAHVFETGEEARAFLERGDRG